MHDDLHTAYNHTKHEAKLYSMWEKAGAFQPNFGDRSQVIDDSQDSTAKSQQPSAKSNLPRFSVIMPPPNANGSLHIGHAVFVTLEDIMVRYHRMKGEPTLWLPGADHAGFETQVVYQKKLEKEGKNWFSIPRDELYNEIKEFTLTNKEIMENQLRRLGASCDWTREKFTLDDDIIKIVYQTFKELYDDGLVYRDAHIINWCTKHQTTLSDLEVKHVEQKDPLYFIKYGPIELATVRLETKFGDTAIAVNPNDTRYQKYIGKEIEIDTLIGKATIKIIADEAVDMEFGTGAVKVTPAHDPTDFDIWQRHKDQIPGPKVVIDQFGKLTDLAGEYQGLSVKDAREKIAIDMAKKGLLDESKTDHNYTHAVATCYKCGRVIEPMVLPQWFIRMTAPIQNSKLKSQKYGVASPRSENEGKSLKDLGVEAVKTGEVKFVTKKFEKIYLHWLENLRDWNISRQIVWGIRLPVFYCRNYQDTNNNDQTNPKSQSSNSQQPTANSQCQPIITAGEKPEKCPTCGDTNLIQDPDVFDTWFSSGQWTFAPLMATNINHPEQKERLRDFKTFYPTSVMETGHDILFFWVARMIMLGKYKTGKAPFKHVYLHGLVRDKDRQKMSKSKSNVVDPLGVIDQYGADALRMALVFGASAGNDIIISEEKIKGMRNFSNKVWNIARFVITNLASQKSKVKSLSRVKLRGQKSEPKTEADQEILKKLGETERSVRKDIENFHFHEAAQTMYQFIWHDFADNYIEASKKQLEDVSLSLTTCYVLLTTVTTSLKLLHPFMPFVTEAVWQEMYKRGLVKEKMLNAAQININHK